MGAVFLLLDSLGVTQSLYSVTAAVTIPVRTSLHEVGTHINDFFSVSSRISTLRDENTQLRNENIDLYEQLSQLRALEEENRQLKQQLKIREDDRVFIVQGRVIGAAVTLDNSIQINLGTRNECARGRYCCQWYICSGRSQRGRDERSSRVSLITLLL